MQWEQLYPLLSLSFARFKQSCPRPFWKDTLSTLPRSSCNSVQFNFAFFFAHLFYNATQSCNLRRKPCWEAALYFIYTSWVNSPYIASQMLTKDNWHCSAVISMIYDFSESYKAQQLATVMWCLATCNFSLWMSAHGFQFLSTTSLLKNREPFHFEQQQKDDSIKASCAEPCTKEQYNVPWRSGNYARKSERSTLVQCSFIIFYQLWRGRWHAVKAFSGS